MNEQLKLSQLTISAQSVSIINVLINAAEKFMNSFNQSELLISFSNRNNTEKCKEYEMKYLSFFSQISPMISELSSLNARLATLIIKSDKAMEIELTALCESKFNAFEAFERTLYEYIEAMEASFERSSATPLSIVNSTQRLVNALKALKEINL